jgi:serine/threonine protein kinase
MSELTHEPSSHPNEPPAAAANSTAVEDNLLAALADDFAERVRRQERPAVEEYAAKHPELADRIRKLFPTIALMEESRTIDAAETAGSEGPGSIIGRYKLLERIGEGGFGVVYMAEQQQPVRRKVALKVVKPGMDSHRVLARFEAERQALAMMDHANIAKVHDAGTTENGRPYFVMELVQGVPITEYCDQCSLPTRERLELFVTVCQAVQHAHQKGVIHRDIKPTNVLVAIQDGQPAPKIIDFGVAKAIGQQLTEHTLMTAFAQIVGTPLYMSPEQAELSPLGVDTRSDIYSLGVLLYELLTGSTPLDKERLHAASYDELRRIIREEEPPRPSARISTLAADLATTVAEHRRTDARRLRQTVRGELDWIVMKCLEKERNRRYETPNSLARDIEHYLNDEAVQACPPSLAYRLKKFVRRNKVAAAFVVLLLVGLATLGMSNIAIKRERDAKTAALVQATSESARANATSNWMHSMLSYPFPDEVTNSAYTVRELLDDSVTRLDEEATEAPDIQAAIRSFVGRSYWHLGLHDHAVQQLRQALKLRRQAFGSNHVLVADSLLELANVLPEQGKFSEAESCVREAVSLYERMDSRHHLTGSLAEALYVTALLQLRRGDKAGYRATCEALVDLPLNRGDVVTDSRSIWPLCLVPDALADMSRPLKNAEALLKNNSQKHAHFCLYVLGAALYRVGNYELAAQRLEESIHTVPGFPETDRDNVNYQRLLLAMSHWKLGRKDEARRQLAEAQAAVLKDLENPSIRWNRQVSLELLLAEAEALIEPKKADEAVENNSRSSEKPSNENLTPDT